MFVLGRTGSSVHELGKAFVLCYLLPSGWPLGWRSLLTYDHLAASYLRKVRARIKALHTLLQEEAFSDVVRECQEAHELLLKSCLRSIGIDPPRWHDVGPILRENKDRLPESVSAQLDRITDASKRLRKERELSFYGDEDFIPDESYEIGEAQYWILEVEWLFKVLSDVYPPK